MSIYTKKGDKGTSTLYKVKGKERISKADLVFEVLGNIDELNSFIGVSTSFIKVGKKEKIKKKLSFEIEGLLQEVQKDLLTIGSIIAGSKLTFRKKEVRKLEKIIDKFERTLPSLKNFIFPKGSKLASHLHFCRSLARKVERSVVRLSQDRPVKSEILIYLNRLSDFLFILARKVNYDLGVGEEIWRP